LNFRKGQVLCQSARIASHDFGNLGEIASSNARGFIRRELIYNQIFNVMPLRCRHCRSDDFKIRFCESTPRQPEIRIRSEGGGQKKQSFGDDSSAGGTQPSRRCEAYAQGSKGEDKPSREGRYLARHRFQTYSRSSV
jgi:hypothetical protein